MRKGFAIALWTIVSLMVALGIWSSNKDKEERQQRLAQVDADAEARRAEANRPIEKGFYVAMLTPNGLCVDIDATFTFVPSAWHTEPSFDLHGPLIGVGRPEGYRVSPWKKCEEVHPQQVLATCTMREEGRGSGVIPNGVTWVKTTVIRDYNAFRAPTIGEGCERDGGVFALLAPPTVP